VSGEAVTEDRPDVDVAFVVQRYGAGVTGGSESLARAVAERLTAFYRITVFTTCAVDYVTWRNELPSGAEEVGGVAVRRFPSAEERDLAAFNRYSEELYARERTREEELEWLRRQGPYVPSLVEALAAERARFSAVVFFTYLYYPTYWGLRAAPERSVLVPTTHDEPPLRFSIFREVFAAPRALAFLTPPEEALVRSRFELADRPAEVTGIGVDMPEEAPDVGGFRRRNGLREPYAVYAGRIDAGKGCDQMLAGFARYRSHGGLADLVLLGRLAMDLPEVEGVRYLGFVSEEDKRAAFAGASAVVCPSPYESLSIVLLEAFAVGTPGLVNARSAVLKDHCLRSNGGLYYEDAEEFTEALDSIVRDERLRRALGDAGRRYVAEHYRWDAVLARFRRLIDTAARR
jgi:glycosyltransferase involved in cell wall biosynthesis